MKSVFFLALASIGLSACVVAEPAYEYQQPAPPHHLVYEQPAPTVIGPGPIVIAPAYSTYNHGHHYRRGWHR